MIEKKRLSIKAILILGMVGLVVSTVLFSILSTYVSSRKVFLNHAQDIMYNISSYTIDKSGSHLQPAKDAAALTSALAVNDIVNSTNIAEMESYFYEQLSLFTQFSAIYYANTQGEFIMASHYGDQFAPNLTKIISYQSGSRTVEMIYKDVLLDEVRRYWDLNDQYDPRLRPWFLQAVQERQQIWTEPYIFTTSQNPGFTTATPVYNQSGELVGIVGVDIEIDELSDFLATLKIGENGKAFILNSQGSVIAFPDKDKLKHSVGEEETLRLTNISELDDPVGRQAYQEYRDIQESQSESRFLSFDYQGQTYHAMFTPFKVSRWPWTLVIYLPEDDYIGILKENRLFNLFFTLGAGLFSSLIGLIIALSISRPMVKLQRAAENVEQQKLKRPVRIPSIYREIYKTGTSFDKMRLSLLEYQNDMEDLVATRTQELKESNLDLEHTVTVLSATQEDLKRARRQAEKASQAKSDFLASISHEIRTPLGGILGFAEMIQQSEEQGMAKGYATTIIQEGNRLSRLINSLLDLAKIESGELTLEKIPLKLEDLLRSVIMLLRQKAEEKSVSYEYHIEGPLPDSVIGDSLRLSQVLINLMSNALKFTHHGSVTLELKTEMLKTEKYNITFSVKDTGIGIPAEKIATVFQDYSQADSKTARIYGGTGLGLPISHRLVSLMGGNLEVQSTPGEGSCFYFTIEVDSIEEQKKETLESKDDQRENLEGRSILVVDDSPTNRDIVAFHLKKCLCEVRFAENGKQAIEIIEKEKPELVIMDVNMPEMGGKEATRILREKGLDLPIIALSANAFQEDIQSCIEAGMNDCLVKPFTGKGLISCISTWLPPSEKEK
ncbi:MAG: ATP-binding protein [Spirochaetaceae bacterium]|jgi:signal transduction histidine kinase|nr:ATP-binding protein [Spirochaetaceae bacterium]